MPRSKSHPVAVWLATLGLVAVAQASPAPQLTIYYEERPPYMSRQGDTLLGLVGSRAVGALKQAGISFTLHEAPIARQVAFVERNSTPLCGLGFYRTAAREQFGKYSVPIYRSGPQTAIVRADNPNMASFTSLKKALANPDVRLVLRNGYSYGAPMDTLFHSAAAQVLRLPEPSEARARMVHRGMADMALYSLEEAEALMIDLENVSKDLRLKVFRDAPPGEPRHFFCSKSVSDEMLAQVNAALNLQR